MLEDKILVVDDDAATRQLFESLFSHAGFSVYSAKDGNSAKELLEEHYFHLIFLDILLPDISGSELANLIRQDNALSTIVALTEYEPIDNTEKYIEVGFNCCFKKPFRLEKLLMVTKQVFEGQTG